MIKEYVRKDLRQFKPYHVLDQEYEIKLDANESPFALSENLKQKVIQWLKEKEDFNIYPDTEVVDLRKKLAEKWEVDPNQIICGVGSDQIIDYIMKIFLDPGDQVVMPTPSFSMYKLTCMMNHGIPIEVSLNADFSYPIDEIIHLCKERQPKLLFLCTPNNPTGNTIPLGDIRKILDEVECPVVVDEAYAEFSNTTFISLTREYPQLIVLRTFSKAYGIAGLRIGYAISSEECIETINIAKPPYNLNTFSQLVALEILKREEEYQNHIQQMIAEREWFKTQLEAVEGIRVFPSEANFLLVQTTVTNLAEQLIDQKILVRSFTEEGLLKGCTRISMGTHEQNENVMEAIHRIVKKG